MRIVGVSFDAPDTNQAWAVDEGFQYDLWTDESRALAVHYGAATSTTQRFANRVTKVLDADGALVLEYTSNLVVGAHPQQVLDDCEALFGE